MSIIKNIDSLNAAIECTAVIAKAMTAASVYPQDGPIYQEYQKCILTLSGVADRLAQDALVPVEAGEELPPVVPEPAEPAPAVPDEPEPQEPELPITPDPEEPAQQPE